MTVLESLISSVVFHQPLRSMYSLFLLYYSFCIYYQTSAALMHALTLDPLPLGVIWSTVRWWHAAQRPGHHIFVRREPLGGQRKNGRAFWFPTFAGQVCRWIVQGVKTGRPFTKSAEVGLVLQLQVAHG